MVSPKAGSAAAAALPATNSSMIAVAGLTKRYGAIRAVNGVSFAIGRGEIFGLLGPNGAGKSTLIRMLTGLTRPDEGWVAIAGRDLATDSAAIKRMIGVVPQENNLDRELTALENLRIYGRLHRVAALEERIAIVLAEVELSDRRDTLVNKLSGGMKRRLIIARALLGEPAVLFLDEPSIGLDPQIRRQLWGIVRRAARAGCTVLLTTHYIEEAEALCNRVGILRKGELIALDTPAALKTRVGSYMVEHLGDDGRLRQQPAGSRDEALNLAADLANGCTVRRSNLEDVFVLLTGERLE